MGDTHIGLSTSGHRVAPTWRADWACLARDFQRSMWAARGLSPSFVGAYEEGDSVPGHVQNPAYSSLLRLHGNTENTVDGIVEAEGLCVRLP